MTQVRRADTVRPMLPDSAHYLSTRGQAPRADFAEALIRGMAPDGGLYMPEAWPTLPARGIEAGADYKAIGLDVLPAFVGDALPAGALERALDALSQASTTRR